MTMYATVRSCWPWLKARAGATPASILIVDDDAWVRAYVDRVMRDAGYRTVLARDGAEALAISEQIGSIDLLVTDELIRRRAGHELAWQLWQRDPNLKVLYLTGSRDRLSFSEKVALWESEAFLDQPSTATGLLQTVSLLLNSSPRHLCRAVHRLDVKRGSRCDARTSAPATTVSTGTVATRADGYSSRVVLRWDSRCHG